MSGEYNESIKGQWIKKWIQIPWLVLAFSQRCHGCCILHVLNSVSHMMDYNEICTQCETLSIQCHAYRKTKKRDEQHQSKTKTSGALQQAVNSLKAKYKLCEGVLTKCYSNLRKQSFSTFEKTVLSIIIIIKLLPFIVINRRIKSPLLSSVLPKSHLINHIHYDAFRLSCVLTHC